MDTTPPDIRRLVQSGAAGWADVPRLGRHGGIMAPPNAGSVLVERKTGCILLSSGGSSITRKQRVGFRRGIRFNRGDFRQHATNFEGNVSFMYLDVGGNVTVGLGHRLASAGKAQKLLFLERKTKVTVHAKHIENAFNLVRNSGLAGAHHSKFKNLTHIDLSLTDIDKLFDADVDEFVNQLGSFFKGYETYPAKVQLAMLDMAFNMGTKNFFNKFKKFRAALALRNWIKVADESERSAKDSNGVSIPNMPARNIKVRQWILDAIKEQPFFINPACPPKLVS